MDPNKLPQISAIERIQIQKTSVGRKLAVLEYIELIANVENTSLEVYNANVTNN